MAANVKIFLLYFTCIWMHDVSAQSGHACDSILYRAHKKLGGLYEKSAAGDGYTFTVTVVATYRDKSIGEVKPQLYRMAVSGGRLLFESDNLDSFQNDSIRVSVIKNQNKIYIADSDWKGTTETYMDQFNSVQKILPALGTIDACREVDGKIHLRTTMSTDTLGLSGVKSMAYVIDKTSNNITQIVFEFTDVEPIISYSISYSDLVKPYVMPANVVNRYIEIAHRSSAGLQKIDQYSIIDNRKKINP